MSAADHNLFVHETLPTLGQRLIEMGNAPEQLVAVESLFAGAIVFIAKQNLKSVEWADEMTKACAQGARTRLRKLFREITP